MIYVILFVLFLHWVADFIAQTRWMAENKSKDNKALMLHIITYGLVMYVGLLIGAPFLKLHLGLILAYVIINCAIHCGVDFVTSRMNAHFWQTWKQNYFWWNIGFDQYVHQVCLISLAAWLLA
jgi:hypothetical protein